MELAAGPIPLSLKAPQANQKLLATIGTNQDGFTASVTDAQGKRLSGEAWGLLSVHSADGCTQIGPLLNTPDDRWTVSWEGCDSQTQSGGQFTLEGWVAARGYVAGSFTQSVTLVSGKKSVVPTAVPAAVPAAVPTAVPTTSTR